MEHKFEDLKKKTVAELREIAKESEHDALKGYTQMNKQNLLLAVCKALDVEAHAHHDVVGIDRQAIKTKINELKLQRNAALEAKDAVQLHRVRRKIHRLKRKIRSATI